jgi:hypothetical protein
LPRSTSASAKTHTEGSKIAVLALKSAMRHAIHDEIVAPNGLLHETPRRRLLVTFGQGPVIGSPQKAHCTAIAPYLAERRPVAVAKPARRFKNRRIDSGY